MTIEVKNKKPSTPQKTSNRKRDYSSNSPERRPLREDTNITNHDAGANVSGEPLNHDSGESEKNSVVWNYMNRIPTPSKSVINENRRRMARSSGASKIDDVQGEPGTPCASKAGPTIYITGWPTSMLRGIATELK